MYRVGILTISDKGSRGEREDVSGREIMHMVKSIPALVTDYEIIPDEKDLIKDKIVEYSDKRRLDLILTTGGTGVSPRDVTPEATKEAIDRELPGFAESMRRDSFSRTPHAIISRAVSGIRGSSLIINLPGSPRAVRENLAVVFPALRHAIDKIKGDVSECGND